MNIITLLSLSIAIKQRRLLNKSAESHLQLGFENTLIFLHSYNLQLLISVTRENAQSDATFYLGDNPDSFGILNMIFHSKIRLMTALEVLR